MHDNYILNKARCLLHKLDLRLIISREQGTQCFRKYSQSWQSKFLARWTHEGFQENPNCAGSSMLNLRTSVEAYSSDQVEVKQSVEVLRIYLIDREKNVEMGWTQVSVKPCASDCFYTVDFKTWLNNISAFQVSYKLCFSDF